MRFGDCSDCGEYKYLEEDGKCVSCIEGVQSEGDDSDSDECWAFTSYEGCEKCGSPECNHSNKTVLICGQSQKPVSKCSCDGFFSNNGPDSDVDFVPTY